LVSRNERNVHSIAGIGYSKDDVINNVHDTETKTSVKRLEPVMEIQSDRVPTRFVDVLRAIWEINQMSKPHHLATSNSQQFASFIFEKITGEKWSPTISATIDSFFNKLMKNKKIQPGIKIQNPKSQKQFKLNNF
jgi:hypothetical protein